MTINESLIDKRIHQAVTYYGSAEMSLKLTAIAAARVVGKYDGTTAEIAKQIRRSPSTVENLAHAFWLYEYERKAYKSASRDLWRELPISHWWIAYDHIHSVGCRALKYLDMAYSHGWSGRRMLQEFRVDYEREHGAPPPVKIERVYSRAVNVVTDILARIGEADAVVAAWAQEGLNLFAERGIVREEE